MAREKDPTRVAAGKRSAGKGSKWQRDVAKALTVWSGKPWKSTPRSGGLRWNTAHWVFGDITPPEDVYIVIECKHHADLQFLDVLGTNYSAQGTDLLSQWYYEQLAGDAQRAEDAIGRPMVPLLMWKTDHRRPRISFCSELFSKLAVEMAVLETRVPGRSPFVTGDLGMFFHTVTFDRFLAVTGHQPVAPIDR